LIRLLWPVYLFAVLDSLRYQYPYGMETQLLKNHLREIIAQQVTSELDSEMPDMQCALTSLAFANSSLDKFWEHSTAEDFLTRYRQVLENRFRRLTEEDAGEFGSGRDALGVILARVEELQEQAIAA